MENNITDLLPESIRAELGEDSIKAIQEAFKNAVDRKVDEQVALAVKCAEANFDEETNKSVTELMEMAELNYKLKVAKALNTLKEKFEQREAKIKAYYNKQLTESAKAFQKALVKRIDESIRRGVASAIPTKQLQESLRNKMAIDTIAHMKNLLSVNDTTVREAYRPAIREAKKRIDESSERATLLEERNKSLIEENKALKADLYLAERTKNLSPEAQAYMQRVMKGSTEKFIKENFQNVYGMFKRQDEGRREAVAQLTLESRLNSKQSRESQKINRKSLVKTKAAKPVNESKDAVGSFLDILEQSED